MKHSQEIACDAFRAIIYLRKKLLYRIVKRPDMENRNTKDVDFLLECEGETPIAVEHTTIDSFEDQRGISRLHSDFVQHISAILRVPQNNYYKLCLPTEFYKEMNTKRRKTYVPTIQSWVSDALEHLTPNNKPLRLTIEDGRYDVWLECGGSHPSLNGKLLAALAAPRDLEIARRDRIHRALTEKLPKLSSYDKKRMQTWLLLEDTDLSLSNNLLVKDALLKLRKEYGLFAPFGIMLLSNYRDEIVEATLIKEGKNWSSRIRKRGPFYEFTLPTTESPENPTKESAP